MVTSGIMRCLKFRLSTFFALIAAPLLSAAGPVPIATPAQPGSGQPNLFVARGGQVLLSWLEKAGAAGHALKFARLDSTEEPPGWKEVRTVASGQKWFVNWADFPSIVQYGETLAVHWLKRGVGGPYAYDTLMSQSRDGGKTWSPPFQLNDDQTPTEHGFVSLVPADDTRLVAIWLDGRDMGESEAGAMSLRYRQLGPDGPLGGSTLLDDRVCDCCQTTAVNIEDRIVVAYRDRSREEIRDISLLHIGQDGTTEPATVAADRWKINACPVNGPSLAASGGTVALAWYTEGGDARSVKASLSRDGGWHFDAPRRIDLGNPLGRVDVAVVPSGNAYVTWLEDSNEETRILLRSVGLDGSLGPVEVVSRSAAARRSGFPQMVAAGERLFFAWTDTSDAAGPTVRTSFLRLEPRRR